MQSIWEPEPLTLVPKLVENCLPLIFEGRAYLLRNGKLLLIEWAELVEDTDGADLYIRGEVLLPRSEWARRYRQLQPNYFELDFGEVVWIKN